jgi:hypothetical protein
MPATSNAWKEDRATETQTGREQHPLPRLDATTTIPRRSRQT